VALLAADFLLLRNAGARRVGVRETALWSLAWFAVAVAFGIWMWWNFSGLHGPEVVAERKALEYFTGYLLEKGLAVENVFVWITIFGYFAVPAELQKRVLLWGVVGAITMRAVLIYLGALLAQAYAWISYTFGAVLLVTGVKMLLATGTKQDLDRNPLLGWLRRHLPLTARLEGDGFWVRRDDALMATPLLLVLVQVSDLVFALDSIPAIFAVTGDPFIVFTANTFAVLGLRALYFLLADFHHVPIPLMLAVVVLILAISVAASLVTRPSPDARDESAA
jgi:tellurite resistance protein TerC